MSSHGDAVGPALLRGWPLPDPGDSKDSRGRVLVVRWCPAPGSLLERLADAFPDGLPIVLDAYTIGALAASGRTPSGWRGHLMLTPNGSEAARLLGVQPEDIVDLVPAVREIAKRYQAVVSCYGNVAEPGGNYWTLGTGHPGLGTSGSDDVLAGAAVGLRARGADGPQAMCWATYLHCAAGDRLAARMGRLGFLARELLDEIPLVLTELQA